jgi:DNA-binding MarR family transcriptional regulator
VPSADLADAVARLRRAMRRAARAADPGSTLSVAQLEMLSCLAENPGARPGRLAALLRLAPSSVATLTQGLRRADLVTRTGGTDDRRTACLRLTPAGEATVIRWKVLNEKLLRTAFAALPAGSRSTIQAALPALTELAGAVNALADEQLASQGDPGQGDASQGDPGQGDASQGDASQGDPGQGDASQGDASQGDASQGDPGQGDPGQGGAGQGSLAPIERSVASATAAPGGPSPPAMSA